MPEIRPLLHQLKVGFRAVQHQRPPLWPRAANVSMLLHLLWMLHLVILVAPLAGENRTTLQSKKWRNHGNHHRDANANHRSHHRHTNGHDVPQLMYGDDSFMEIDRSRIKHDIVSNTEEPIVKNPITFRSPSAYLVTHLNFYATFTIYFHLKTTQPDGLIFYSGSGSGKDFLALELVNGRLKYVFDVGSGPKIIKAHVRANLNDNKWHLISLVRPNLTQQILRVDEDLVTYDDLEDTSTVHFDTDDAFYIGGIKRDMFDALPKKVRSRVGFQGCLGSLNLDGDRRHLLEHHRAMVPEQFTEDVVKGCQGPALECTETSCDNRGICIQEWNSYRCDCDLTSYTGPRCRQDGIAYTFGASGGLIHYAFTDRETHNTKRDELALGFITNQKDAVLVRINSRGSDDYVEMELVDGKIYVVYNMGTMDHPIGQLFDRVDDGNYHVVRFIRNGANASVQIDNTEPQVKHPIGSNQWSVFNGVGDVLIGGRLDEHEELVKPFAGTIAGLVLNGLAILEKAAEENDHVMIRGEVDLQFQKLKRFPSITDEPSTKAVIVTPQAADLTTPGMQSTMGVKTTPRVNDASEDLVFARADCEEVDVADCPDIEVDPDALISPKVTFKPTPPSSTTASPTPTELDELEAPCEADDEDCITGSGSGFKIIEPGITPKTDNTDDKDQIVIDAGTEPTAIDSTSPEVNIFVDQNMTEKPLPNHGPNPRPGQSTTTPPPRGGSGSGGPGSAPKVPNPHDSRDPLKRGGTALGTNIGLIVGIAVGVVVLLLVVAFIFYKYKSRDEGSYKIDESKNYSYETCNTKPPPQVNGAGYAKASPNCSKSKKKDVKEWYV